MKNILFFETWPNLAGEQFCMFDIANNLDKNRFYCEFLSVFDGAFNEYCEKRGYKVNYLKLPHFLKSGILKKNILFNIIVVIILTISVLINSVRLIFLIYKKKFKVIYCANIFAVMLVAIPCVIMRCKIIWHIHYHIVPRLMIFYKIGIVLSEHIIVLTEKEKKNYIKLIDGYTNKFTTIHNSISDDFINSSVEKILRKKYAIEEDTICIGQIGRVSSEKGVENFIAAAELILKEFDKCVFFIVGGYDETSEYYKHLLTLRKSENKIIFAGFMHEVASAINSMDIIAAPSKIENFGRIIIEAGYLKKAVVASNVGGIPEATDNGKTAVLIDTNDIQLFAAELKKLILNKELRIQLGEKAYTFVNNNFLMRNNIKKYESLL